MIPATIEKRTHPLTVRMPDAEKALLADAASSLGISRNKFVRRAAMGLLAELQAGRLIP
jgi:uncharacterized protein (DUF1778 family)